MLQRSDSLTETQTWKGRVPAVMGVLAGREGMAQPHVPVTQGSLSQ